MIQATERCRRGPRRATGLTRATRDGRATLHLAVTLLAGLTSGHAASGLAETRQPAASITSDRPGLGDGAGVVGPGVWQAEMGLTFRDTGPQRLGEGTALVRGGFSAAELRLYLPTPSYSNDTDSAELGDIGVGFKLPISESEAWRWSLVGGAFFPTGTDGATADETSGFATLAGETSLSDNLFLALNGGVSQSFETSDGTTWSFLPTFSTGITDTVSAYAGYAGYYSDDGDEHWGEAGIFVSLSPDVEWGINSAYDVENDAWFIGVGFSKRWR